MQLFRGILTKQQQTKMISVQKANFLYDMEVMRYATRIISPVSNLWVMES
jgi:hypothetical protein